MIKAGQRAELPAGQPPVEWWQHRFDTDFPRGLLATPVKLGGTDPVFQVPRVEVLREHSGWPEVLFAGRGWDIGVEGTVASYEAIQDQPCLVVVLTFTDGRQFKLSNGVSRQVAALLEHDRKVLIAYSREHGKSLHQ